MTSQAMYKHPIQLNAVPAVLCVLSAVLTRQLKEKSGRWETKSQEAYRFMRLTGSFP